MTKILRQMTMLCLLAMVATITTAQNETTALWDFQNVNPATLVDEANLQGKTGTVKSTLDGIVMTVDATNGKLKQRDSDAQFNQGTILRVPVKSAWDIVTVTAYPKYHNYTIGGIAADTDVTEHKATASEVVQGYVEIVSTGSSYLYCIKTEFISPIQEKQLYSTDFTEWGDYENGSSYKTADPVSITWNTKYSHESLTFDIYDTQIGASNFNTSKFPNWEGGMLMADKSDKPYVTTSALASITKVNFTHGATGGNRGWKLWAKGDGDTDWVVISDAVANPASGSTVNATINRTNCQLKFTNLTSNQNAYLLSLEIFGNVDLSQSPTLGTFKVNGTSYNAGDIFTENSNGEMEATIKLSKSEAMVSEDNPLTEISADNGEIASATYTKDGDGCVVTITVKTGDNVKIYKLTIIRKPDYTLTYINTDGTLLGTQTVEEDAPISTFTKGEDDVTIADGKKFRGWFISTIGGQKITSEYVVTTDMKLYAVATDIETMSPSQRYTFNLADKYFYDEDHEAINITGGQYYNNHGWTLAADSKIDLLVGGHAYLLFDLCQYSKGNLTLSDSEGNVIQSFSAQAVKDGQTQAVEYKGKATTLTLTTDNSYYLHKVVIANMESSPIEKNKQGIYVVEAGSAASFLNTLLIANATASNDARTIVFLPNGTYDLGNECLTPISGNNISIIGQDMTKTIIMNTPEVEGIGVTATLFVTGENTYLQDLTLQNAYDYYKPGFAGRAVCLQDKGNRTICKNVELKSYQDTYYSNANGQYYFENSNIHGTVDFICGSGDVFFNECTLTVEPRNADGSGECTITAPYTDASSIFGYVFNNCNIDSKAEKFNYGRAWGGMPRCAYLNTTLLQPDRLNKNRWTAGGMNVPADKFVEYNTMDKNGTVISPSSHIVKFTKDNKTNEIETILTADQASEYDIDKVFTNWTPNEMAMQKTQSEVKINGTELSWETVEGVETYAVFKNEELVGFTSITSYTIDDEKATYTVRAANRMGGLGRAVKAGIGTGINSTASDSTNAPLYNLMGMKVEKGAKGLLIQNGKKQIVK